MKIIPQKFLFFGLLICASTTGNANQNINVTPDDHHLADAVNSLGHKLLTNIMRNNVNQNIVMSPTGIAGLLAMTLLGTVGVTYDELAHTLGFSQDILHNRRNHEEFGKLLEALNNDHGSLTSYADAIFVDHNSKIRDSYRNYLNTVYHGDVLSVKFEEVVKAKDIINEWISNNTKGNIENFLKNPLPMSTKVALLSALYFKGQWAKPFVPEYTRSMPFKTPTGPIDTDLMLNFGFFDYTHSFHEGLHIISLPYNDSANTMYVLMPRVTKHKNLTDIMESIDYTRINQLIDNMKMRECVVRFPKMNVKNSINLEKDFRELGINSIFSPKNANFALMIDGQNMMDKTENELISRINHGDWDAKGVKDKLNSLTNPGVYIDTVLHDVRISINEFGTEAAAATSGVLARSAELFYADSPFYMFIRNEKTKLVTFSALIVDPTQFL